MCRLIIALALWLLTPTVASAQCVFARGQLDNIPPLAAGEVKPPWNTIICAVNAVETRLNATLKQDTACVTVTVPAAAAPTVTLTGLAAFKGTEVVTASFVDTHNPPAVVIDAITTPIVTATTLNLVVFNQDADYAHTGQLCAVILRP